MTQMEDNASLTGENFLETLRFLQSEGIKTENIYEHVQFTFICCYS